MSDLFSDFELSGGASQWGPVWFWYSDRCYDPPTCNAGWGPCTTTTTATSFPIDTTIPPVDTGGDTLTPGNAGHFVGILGDGPSGCGTGNYSYALMECYFSAASTLASPVSVDFVTSLPTVGEHGVNFYMKLGPSAQAGQDYHVAIVKGAITQGGAQYYYDVPAASLSTGAWTFIQAPFPAAGTSAQQPAATFAQPSGTWVSPVNWDMTDLQSIQVAPATNNVPYDIYIDDIRFY